MLRFRILIVDDERLSRTRLRRLISLDPDCDLVGECADGAEAVAALDRLLPDIVLLDVQMPELDGFGVIRAMGSTHPLVILTSAHGEHALRAFEADVFDYLLKPFDRQRFQQSLRRAKARITNDRVDRHGPQTLPGRIAVRNNRSIVFVKVDDIDWIEAADNYVILHRGKENHIIRATMNELKARLDSARFLRIHRSTIVNLERIQELRPWFRGDYLVILRDGTELALTRNHRTNLESRLLLGAA
jgi:two-component system LytT family response regulator